MVRTAAGLAFFLAPTLALPCMGAGSGGTSVRFDEQANIVIWDKRRGLEHFVRDAKFVTRGASLGFVAPTPTRPTVVAVDRSALGLLEELGPMARSGQGGGGFGGGGGGRSVAIVERKLVAGYEATVLRAADPQALADWLRENDYSVPRSAARWAAPYVRRGWYFTAFKVAAAEGAGATGPVRMTFRTETPFNPYSVPAENQGRGGLSLYYISPTPEEGKIGGRSFWVVQQWERELSDENARKLETSLKLNPNVMPPNSKVRYYYDPAFGRPGFDDLYFVPSKPVEKAGTMSLSAILGLAALGVIGRRGRM